MNQKDLDGNTAFDLAVTAKAVGTAELLMPKNPLRLQRCGIDSWPPTDEWITKKRTETAKIQQRRIVAEKENKKQEELKHIKDNYSHLHRILVDDHITEEEVIDLLISKEIGKLLKGSDASLANLKWLEPTPGVFLIPEFFSPEAVRMLKSECDNFLDSDLP